MLLPSIIRPPYLYFFDNPGITSPLEWSSNLRDIAAHPGSIQRDGGRHEMTAIWDVGVVGGGPAGLAAAIALQLRGFRVFVAAGMRPPIDKACGEGLMPDSVAA